MKVFDDKIASSYAGIVKDHSVWFSLNELNGLLKLNIESGKIEYIGSFPDESMARVKQHIKALSIGDLLIFIPFYSRNVHIYNIQTNSFESILIDGVGKKGILMRDAFAVGNNIWMIPFDTDGDLFCLNVKTMCLEKKEAFSTGIRSNLISRDIFNAIDFSPSCDFYNENIYFGLCNSLWGKYNVINQELVINDLGQGYITGVHKSDNGVYIQLGDSKGIIKINEETGDEVICSSNSSYTVFDKSHRPYMTFLETGKDQYVIPAYGRQILKKQNDDYVVVNDLSGYLNDVQEGKMVFYGVAKGEGLFVLLPFGTSRFFVFNDEMRMLSDIGFEIKDTMFRKNVINSYYESGKETKTVLKEGCELFLKEYIECVCD